MKCMIIARAARRNGLVMLQFLPFGVRAGGERTLESGSELAEWVTLEKDLSTRSLASPNAWKSGSRSDVRPAWGPRKSILRKFGR